MMDALRGIDIVTYGVYALIIVIPLILYLRKLQRTEEQGRQAAEKGKLFSEGPRAQHPHIDTANCLGCGTCAEACFEGVLAVFGGRSVIVNGYKCVGHGFCAQACPVGAITMMMADPSMSADMPCLTPEFETNIPNLFIVGELGGLALIKNAINQGRDCIDTITTRMRQGRFPASGPDIYDVLIVGAGPGGISASLRAIENKLTYITLEQDEVGGTVAKYPRQKLVMTSPVQFPGYGKFKRTELSKENLLAFWDMVLNRADFNVRTDEKVEDIRKNEDGLFTIHTVNNQYRARAVVLALGRSGSPKKLGVKGENLPKVMYRLIEADHYINKNILVVGGGDSAVEAAMGLARQPRNKVTLSYRKESFHRIKERNVNRIQEGIRTGKINAVFNSVPVEFKPNAAVLDVNGRQQEIPNDFVWIFAGGVPPNDFLKKIGVRLGACDLTREASNEANQGAASNRQVALAATNSQS